jgi:hypothetical protein
MKRNELGKRSATDIPNGVIFVGVLLLIVRNTSGLEFTQCCRQIRFPVSVGRTGGPPLARFVPPQGVWPNDCHANIYIGSSPSGSGVFVQQDTLTYYIGWDLCEKARDLRRGLLKQR